ncbi:FixH family protein [Solirubrobacter ginsenosidimutans]|uniref:FixH family protein n=1 Tax=Solirubrobacter ginsenosidimutans TaxID=490573 RepID=A0A9X3MZY9_9ACTN|nr:FixH family protein [Solirubrobacter ginsenosidimutans]MDA0164508.1 FixH family protein [Solirubrobacter ginsenosidimutans]
MRRVLLAVGLLLVFAPAAHAGGWATVGLSSTPSGKTWVVDLTVLQHGVTPLTDVKPAVVILSGDKREVFAAKPTGKPGVYRATVVFPASGRWEYQVDDGFISQQLHTYPPVQIGDAPAPVTTPSGDDGPNLLWLIGGLALLLAAAALLIVPRLRTRSQHPQAA